MKFPVTAKRENTALRIQVIILAMKVSTVFSKVTSRKEQFKLLRWFLFMFRKKKISTARTSKTGQKYKSTYICIFGAAADVYNIRKA